VANAKTRPSAGGGRRQRPAAGGRAAGGASKGGGAKAGGAKKAGGAGNGKGTRPGKTGATRRPARTQGALAPHWRDIQGVLLIVFALLLALAIWWNASGLVMDFLDLLLRSLFGYVGYGVPVLVAVLGLLVLRNREPIEEPVTGRVLIGGIMILLGSIGLLHLAYGAPFLSAGNVRLQNSGGAVGAVLAAPLARFLSPWGAGVVWVAVLFLGLLVTTKTPVSMVARGLARVGHWFAGLFHQVQTEITHAGDTLDDELETTSVLELLDAEPQPPAQRRRRAPATPPATETVELGPAPSVAVPAPVAAPAPATRKSVSASPPPPDPSGDYVTPPVELLRRSQSRPVDPRRLDEAAQTLERVLDQFEVDAHVARYTRGPTVTRYEVELGPATKVAKVVGLAHDIAYALASPDVRIIAPIPGKSAIGIEVPNRDRDLVTLGDIIFPEGDSDDGRSPLTVALGKDIAGDTVLANLADMPHVLIAGSTGSGKSVCLNVLVTGLLMRNRPEDVRLILIDPKRVEMTNYEGVPHLITPVVTHPKRAAEALAWAVREMELRLETLALAGVRNIGAYNKAVREGKLPPLPSDELDDEGRPAAEQPRPTMPFIVLVIDELADLMMIAPRDVEDAICRIAQMARAVGIHLVVATQRPSVDVVTGLIKANIPSRIAFMVASAQDSRVILDTGGADKLVGHGDMLYLPGGTSKPLRVQGAFIAEKEVEEVVQYCKAQQGARYQPGVVAEGRQAASDDAGDEDPLLDQAMDIIVRSGLGSTSMLQSKMKVGFSRARRIMDQLEERGIVGPSEGSKPRDVLMTVEELDALHDRESTYGELSGD
jgi:S-DNA-T family DNA segregation ATPase FtsK/SpoIIIE